MGRDDIMSETRNITMTINGETANAGNTAALLWDHVFDALSWCLSQPPLASRGLLANDIVMTGTCTGITPLSPGDEAVGDFGAIGQVRARFV